MATATATPVRIQAREIVRYAKRNGLVLTRHALGSGGHHCARSAIRHAVDPKMSLYEDMVNEAVGLTYEEMDSLEQGFDFGYNERNVRWAPSAKYFKVGQNIARLAGLKI